MLLNYSTRLISISDTAAHWENESWYNSSATSIQVTEPYGATITPAAARALLTTATRTAYGLRQRVEAIGAIAWNQAVSIWLSTITLLPQVCAVSLDLNFRDEKYLQKKTVAKHYALIYLITGRCATDRPVFVVNIWNWKKQLCDGGSASYGALQCSNKNGGCPGSYNNNCNPNIVWSGTAASSTYHYYRYLNSGAFSENSYYSTQAYGVRCVPDLDFFKRKRF